VLELARKILTPVTDTKYQLLLSDVHLTLAHLQVEQENSAEALADYEKCLSIRKSINPSDRSVAEA